MRTEEIHLSFYNIAVPRLSFLKQFKLIYITFSTWFKYVFEYYDFTFHINIGRIILAERFITWNIHRLIAKRHKVSLKSEKFVQKEFNQHLHIQLISTCIVLQQFSSWILRKHWNGQIKNFDSNSTNSKISSVLFLANFYFHRLHFAISMCINLNL